MTTERSIRPAPQIKPSVTVDPMHPVLTLHWPNGGSNNIHLPENGDLSARLKRGPAR